MATRHWIGGICATALLLARVSACADEAGLGLPRPGEERRWLAGHAYSLSPVVADPFVPTYFDLSGGAGYGHADNLPTYDLQGKVSGSRPGSLVGFGGTIAYQLGITHWLAARIATGLLILSGTDAHSLLAVGVGARGQGAAIGATAGWNVLSRLRLGATLDVGYAVIADINFGSPLIQTVVDRAINTSGLVTTTNRLQLRPGFTWAFTAHRSLGLFGDIQYAHDFSTTEGHSTDENELIVAAAVDFALRALTPVPISIQFDYRLDADFYEGGKQSFDHLFELGIFYTGRGDLQLGGALSARSVTLFAGPESLLQRPETAGLTIWVYIPQVVFRYYW